MTEDDGTGGVASNFIWAIALIIIVALIVGAVYYGGFWGGSNKKEIDINVTGPSR